VLWCLLNSIAYVEVYHFALPASTDSLASTQALAVASDNFDLIVR
jgi:hypothetical protein